MSSIELRVPGDKSIAHRALVLGCLAQGDSRVSNLPDGADVASTFAMMGALGGELERSDGSVCIRGRGIGSLRAADQTIDAANSGTTARLGIGLAAALAGSTVFTGDDSLRRRPMARVAIPVRAMGARVDYLAGEGVLPLRVTGGRLAPLAWTTPVPSAQVKSALLLAGVAAGIDVEVREPLPSRDHAERLLRLMGVDVESELRGDADVVRMTAPARLNPFDIELPGDFSSAAFLLAAALLAGGPIVTVRGVGVNPRRTGFLDVLAAMDAQVELDGRRDSYEPLADLTVGPAALCGTRVVPIDVVRGIDELALVGVLAAHAEGETVVSGAAELRAKESDRIHALCGNLAALGVKVEERPDGFMVQGSDRPLAGRVHSHGDHRVAMAFAVLGVRPGSRIEVDDLDIARISYPGFAAQLEQIRAAAGASGGGAG